MEICEKHGKNKEIFCSKKECLQAICSKCIRDHSDHGVNFLSIEHLIEELEFKQQESLSKSTHFKHVLDEKLKENSQIISDFEENSLSFPEKVGKIMKSFIEFISKSVKTINEEREQMKSKLIEWVSDASKANEALQRTIDDLLEDMNQTTKALSDHNYMYFYERSLEVKFGNKEDFGALVEEGKFGIEYFENSEKGARQFVIDEFVKFSQMDQFKSQLAHETDKELQEMMRKLKESKIQQIDLEERRSELKREIKYEKRKFYDQQQEFLKNPSFYLRSLENAIQDSQKLILDKFEENKSGIKTATKILLQEFTCPTLSFNSEFVNLTFSGDNLVCSNKNNQSRYCLSTQRLYSDSNLRIQLLFTPGECNRADFGLIEDFDFDPHSNSSQVNCISDKEVFFYKKSGEISENLKGITQKIDKTTEFTICIKNRRLAIYSNNGLISLTGILSKTFYYLGVSPCCNGNAFRILKFFDEPKFNDKIEKLFSNQNSQSSCEFQI